MAFQPADQPRSPGAAVPKASGTGKRLAIRWHLMAFGAALVLPILAFASVPLWQFAHSEQVRYEHEARSAAKRAIDAVDRELSGMLAVVQSLATSPFIPQGDFAAFQQQASAATRIWAPAHSENFGIILRERTGQQLANTRVPWGTPLPKGSMPEADQQVIATKRPLIQGIFVGATAGHPIVSIRVPVLQNEEATHVLAINVEPQHFAEMLQAQALSPAWTGAIIDRNGRVIARSRDQKRYVGTTVTEDLRNNTTGDQGVWIGTTLEGTPVLGAYTRSPLSGWRAAVGVPLSIVSEPLRRSLWAILGLGLATLTLSFVLARWFGQRISWPIRALRDAAGRLGRGEAVSPVASNVLEVDEVAGALAMASEELHEREAALKASEGRLRATYENAGVGIVEVDRDGRLLRVNETHCKLLGYGQEELIGRLFTYTTHPDFRNPDWELFQRQVRGDLPSYTVEKQCIQKDGSASWTRVSSTAVSDAAGHFLYAVRIVEEITERKQAELRQKLLIDELNHRVRNTLATVQAVINLAGRGLTSPEDLQAALKGRIHALSRAHDLLTEGNWGGVPFVGLLRAVLEPYSDVGTRLHMEGPDATLTPSLGTAVSMAFHELASNAARHGAWSVPDGRVEVTWFFVSGEAMRVRWTEGGGPAVTPPQRRGFGVALLGRGLSQQLGTKVQLEFAPEGLRCQFDVPFGLPVREPRDEEPGAKLPGAALVEPSQP